MTAEWPRDADMAPDAARWVPPKVRVFKGRRCGYPSRRCGSPAEFHADAAPGQGEARRWTYHDQACPIPGADPALDDRCSLIRNHAGDCLYTPRPGRSS
jgi:hypothetical protein